MSPSRFSVLRPTADGVLIDVRVIPRARKSEIGGRRDEALLVRLAAPPVDGAANDELVALMAATLKVPRRSVSIVAGETSRQKRVQVVGIDVATAAARLYGLREK